MAQDIIHAEDGARGSLEGLSGPGPAVLSAPSLPPNYHRRAFDLSAVMQNQANSVYAAAQMNFPQQFQIPRAPMQMMPPSVIGGPSFVWANPQEGLYMPAYTGLPQNGVFGSVIAAAPAMDQRTAFDPSNELPVADRTAFQQPRSHGVVKINNIPYGLTIAEVQQFIGKNINEEDLIKPHVDGYPIHIIMERSTGKTMDCYIEIITPEIASDSYERGFGLASCRHPKLGQRHVVVELSDQAELMRDLFPRARSVTWDAKEFGAPTRIGTGDPFSAGFTGFVTTEEMSGVVRHAEAPQRSPFAMRSFQRTFESMISTLYKYPWSSANMYTMAERETMFNSYYRQLEVLIVKVNPHNRTREVGLDNKLLMDFLLAGMNCVGFSERQRSSIVDASYQVGPGMSISVHARHWPFQTLAPHPATLTDQDLSNWLSLLEHGFDTMKAQGREFIGIYPFFEAVRDRGGHVEFRMLAEGLLLDRKPFSQLEKTFANEMVKLGWVKFMEGIGLPSPPAPEPTSYSFIELSTNGVVRLNRRMTDDGLVEAVQVIPDDDDPAAAEALRSPEGRAERSLALYRNVFQNTAEEDAQKTQGLEGRELCKRIQTSVDAGLGDRLDMTLPGPQKFGRGPVSSPQLNPESPIFESDAWKLHAADAPLSTAFAGLGLGNGVINPPRISTARKVPASPAKADAATGKVGAFGGEQPSYFHTPIRERRAIPIRSPHGTEISMPRRASDPSNCSISAALIAEDDDSDEVKDGINFAGTVCTPRLKPTSLTAPNTPRRSESGIEAAIPGIGKPSPRHTRSHAMSSALKLSSVGPGLPVTNTGSNGYSTTQGPGYGSIMRLGNMSMAPSLTEASITSTLGNSPRHRTRARSTINLRETIEEESEVEDFVPGPGPGAAKRF